MSFTSILFPGFFSSFVVAALVASYLYYFIRKRVFPPARCDSIKQNVWFDTENLSPMLSCSATELAARIRSGEWTSYQVVSAYINQVKRVNLSLNALVAERFDFALQEAREVDDLIAGWSEQLHGPLPPFFGVPMAVKECFAMKGLPHTSGLISRKYISSPSTRASTSPLASAKLHLSAYTSPVIQNLQRSGFIVIGSTNVSELCMWMESSNNVYGQTNNPYDFSRTPGGSSGGAGALVAAGGPPVTLGSDVGGSIRMPCFFNGLYGHKPTGGVASVEGQWPPSTGKLERYCQPGPISRYPADLWPVLQIMSGVFSGGMTGVGGDRPSQVFVSTATATPTESFINLPYSPTFTSPQDEKNGKDKKADVNHASKESGEEDEGDKDNKEEEEEEKNNGMDLTKKKTDKDEDKDKDKEKMCNLSHDGWKQTSRAFASQIATFPLVLEPLLCSPEVDIGLKNIYAKLPLAKLLYQDTISTCQPLQLSDSIDDQPQNGSLSDKNSSESYFESYDHENDEDNVTDEEEEKKQVMNESDSESSKLDTNEDRQSSSLRSRLRTRDISRVNSHSPASGRSIRSTPVRSVTAPSASLSPTCSFRPAFDYSASVHRSSSLISLKEQFITAPTNPPSTFISSLSTNFNSFDSGRVSETLSGPIPSFTSRLGRIATEEKTSDTRKPSAMTTFTADVLDDSGTSDENAGCFSGNIGSAASYFDTKNSPKKYTPAASTSSSALLATSPIHSVTYPTNYPYIPSVYDKNALRTAVSSIAPSSPVSLSTSSSSHSSPSSLTTVLEDRNPLMADLSKLTVYMMEGIGLDSDYSCTEDEEDENNESNGESKRYDQNKAGSSTNTSANKAKSGVVSSSSGVSDPSTSSGPQLLNFSLGKPTSRISGEWNGTMKKPRSSLMSYAETRHGSHAYDSSRERLFPEDSVIKAPKASRATRAGRQEGNMEPPMSFKAFPPSTRVSEELLSKQREAAAFLESQGATVLRVHIKEFEQSFDLWSSCIGSEGPSFRELLLQGSGLPFVEKIKDDSMFNIMQKAQAFKIAQMKAEKMEKNEKNEENEKRVNELSLSNTIKTLSLWETISCIFWFIVKEAFLTGYVFYQLLLCIFAPTKCPYTVPALLLALVETVPKLTPAKTRSMIDKSVELSEKLDDILTGKLVPILSTSDEKEKKAQEEGKNKRKSRVALVPQEWVSTDDNSALRDRQYVLLFPAHPVTARKHQKPYLAPLDWIYTGIFNALQSPVTSVPCGLSKNSDMPTGIQIVGAKGYDWLTIGVAMALHQQFRGWVPPPSIYTLTQEETILNRQIAYGRVKDTSSDYLFFDAY